MKNSLKIKTFIYILVFVWTILLLLQGFSLSWGLLKPLTFVTAFAIFLIGAFEKWIWKWKWLYPWFVEIPNLTGTWKGLLVSDWINPENNQRISPIKAYITIHQTYSNIYVKLITQESYSDLINGQLNKSNNIFQVTGVYLNTPKSTVRERSAIHYGGILLNVHQNSSFTLEGQYWTDRKTKGEMFFDKHVENICTNFDDCQKGFENIV